MRRNLILEDASILVITGAELPCKGSDTEERLTEVAATGIDGRNGNDSHKFCKGLDSS